MIKKCNFFLVKNFNNFKLPLIGDVSPDFDPEWLIELSTFGHTKKNKLKKDSWCNLALNFSAYFHNPFREIENKKIYSSNPKSGWYRLNWGEWTAIWHTFTKNSNTKATHSHQDFGSIVLYYKGEEILIDKGRYNYIKLKDSKGNTLSSLYSSHNTIEIDKKPISIIPFQNFPLDYQKMSYSLNFEEFDNHAIVTLIHDGFNRLQGKKINHKRTFYFYADSFKIKDEIIGYQKIDIRINFYFLENPDSKDSKFAFKSYLENNKEIENNLEVLSKRDWLYPAYGAKTKSHCKQINYCGELPFSITHNISMI